MNARKLVAMLLVVSLMLVLPACGEKNVSQDGSEDGYQSALENDTKDSFGEGITADASRLVSSDDNRYEMIRIALASSANNLQPYSRRDAGINPIIQNVYESLFDQYGLDDLRGRLAISYEEIDDLHLNVTIYDYITDTAGNPIKASDVAFSYDLFLNSGYADGDITTYIESVKALNDTTVQFTWKKKVDSLTAYGNCLCNVYIVSEKSYNTYDFANAPVGSGPYKVSEYVTGAYTILEANDDYWQTSELKNERAGQNVQTIRYDVVADAAMRLIALEKGTASYCALDDSTLGDFIEGGKYDGQYQMVYQYSTQNQYLAPNMSASSPMSDINLRLAVYYAVDVEGMAIALGENTYFPCTVDCAPAFSDYQDAWNEARDDYYFVYDPALAKEYLEKSNYAGEDLVIMSGTFPVKKAQAEMVQNMLEAIGITCHVVALENSVLQEEMADPTAWDINIASMVSDNCAAEKLYKQFGVATGWTDGLNYCYLYDETLQNMLDTVMDPEGYSADLLTEILEYTMENAYSYGTLNSVYYYAYSLEYANLVYSYSKTNLIPGACQYYLD